MLARAARGLTVTGMTGSETASTTTAWQAMTAALRRLDDEEFAEPSGERPTQLT
jgi:hypothetical protein